MEVIKEIIKSVKPKLEQHAQELRVMFPNIVITVWNSNTGSLTNYKGYDIGIDCFLHDVKNGQADNVALSIDLKHLTTDPKIVAAGVVWGHPSGFVEKSLLTEQVPYSKDELKKLIKNLPILCDALKKALTRGKPPE